MESWLKHLAFNPVPRLLEAKSQALAYFVHQDLLNDAVEDIRTLWQSREVERIVNRQVENGAWQYPGGGREHLRSFEDYAQLETYRILAQLVEKHGLNKEHSAISRAAEFLFSHQTAEGDFRGTYGNQYSPNYSAAIMELLIKAGYGRDARIEGGLEWLLSLRQNDGGWAIPLRTRGKIFEAKTLTGETLVPDKSKPYSHLVTGIVLRAFAAHEKYRCLDETKAAAYLLALRFFKPDKYTDRKAVHFWTGFSFPFWQTDLLSSLDSISRVGFSPMNPQIKKALDWFVSEQQSDGLWHLHLLRAPKESEADLWLSLAVCRVFKRFFG